jgi:hypothetical protein
MCIPNEFSKVLVFVFEGIQVIVKVEHDTNKGCRFIAFTAVTGDSELCLKTMLNENVVLDETFDKTAEKAAKSFLDAAKDMIQ